MNSMIRMIPLMLMMTVAVHAQSSSVYLEPQPRPDSQQTTARHSRTLPSAVEIYSFTAVTPPQPRFFAINDLITVIVRESTTTDFESTLETDKRSDYIGKMTDFPNLNLSDLLQFQMRASDNTNLPNIGIKFKNKFEGDGEYSTRNEISSRITARVIDVKPNGTLVLEARKFIQSDDESLSLILTGTCRAEDVDIDNTLLSTKLYDLNLIKEHEGELRKASKKGILTKFFDFLFAF